VFNSINENDLLKPCFDVEVKYQWTSTSTGIYRQHKEVNFAAEKALCRYAEII
jgi:hypothetical protein